MPARAEIHRATLSLGGNVGDVVAAFCGALRALENNDDVKIIKHSSFWRTPPWGKTDQPDFLNMAALVETALTPHALLAACLDVEKQAGRDRRERWGPRTLDIDIITYDDLVLDDDVLQLPHPRARDRAFVLVPLAEIAGDVTIGGRSVADLAADADRSGMTRDDAATQALRGM